MQNSGKENKVAGRGNGNGAGERPWSDRCAAEIKTRPEKSIIELMKEHRGKCGREYNPGEQKDTVMFSINRYGL